MATGPSVGGRGRAAAEGVGEASRQLASESKLAPLTTEFWAYVAAVLAVLIAGLASDEFDASRVWLFITILTAAYVLSRGFAKSGTGREQTGIEQGGTPFGGRGRGASSTGGLGDREAAEMDTPLGAHGDIPPAEGERRPGGRGPVL